jgi:hypothetical protein
MCLTGQRDIAMLQGVERYLGTILQVQFAQDPSNMGMDCGPANPQAPSNLLILQTTGHISENPHLGFAE